MNFIKTYEAWKQDFTFPTILEFLKDLSKGKISTNNANMTPVFRKEDLEESLETKIINNPGGGGYGIKDSGHTYYDISYARIRDEKEHDFLIIFEDDKVVSVLYLENDLHYKPYSGLFVVSDILVIFCVGDAGGNLYVFNISNGISEEFFIASIQNGVSNSVAVDGSEYLINLENDFADLGPRIVCRERSSGQISYFKCKRFAYPDIFSEPLKPDSRVTSSPKEWQNLDNSIKPTQPPFNPIGDNAIYIICDECDGEGYYECGECFGESSWDCESCDGTGLCEACDGKGKVDCEDCENGNVECEYCGGSGEIDEEECSSCNGNGQVDCDNCGGDGEFDCQNCGGGSCPSCGGEGNYYCEYCEDGQSECWECSGEGHRSLDTEN